MSVSKQEMEMLCQELALSMEDLVEAACAFRKHVEPEMAAAYVADYIGTLMINQSTEEQNKMLMYVIRRCAEMLTE